MFPKKRFILKKQTEKDTMPQASTKKPDNQQYNNLTSSSLLHLQRTLGNKAVIQMLASQDNVDVSHNFIQRGNGPSTMSGGDGGGDKDRDYSPPKKSIGHSMKKEIEVERGKEKETADKFLDGVGSSPAPGVRVTPSETPQEVSTIGQPITVSTAHSSDGGGNVNVETRQGHVLSREDGSATGINHSYTPGPEGSGIVHYERESYGDMDSALGESLRYVAGQVVIGPHVANIEDQVTGNDKLPSGHPDSNTSDW